MKLQQVVPSEVVVDNDAEMLVLVFEAPLGVGEGVLEINFTGILNEHMKGFYKGYFTFFFTYNRVDEINKHPYQLSGVHIFQDLC